jgi:hypothetical protein
MVCICAQNPATAQNFTRTNKINGPRLNYDREVAGSGHMGDSSLANVH